MTALSDMPEALLDTDTLSLYRRAHAQVTRHAAAYIQRYGQLTFTELTRYEVLRGNPRASVVGCARRDRAGRTHACRSARL